jgi:hypothetical protein
MAAWRRDFVARRSRAGDPTREAYGAERFNEVRKAA